MAHSLRGLYFHVIWSTHERRSLITEHMQEQLYAYIAGIIKKYDGYLLEIGGIENHVHMLIQFNNPDHFSKCIRDVKSCSSGWVHRTFPDKKLFAWQEGYGGIFCKLFHD